MDELEEKLNDSHFKQADRDLLVEIRTTLKRAVEDIKDLKDGTSNKINDLYNRKVDLSEYEKYQKEKEKIEDDYEERIRKLETWGKLAIGGLAILQIIITIWLALK